MPLPSFTNLVPKALSHELFSRSIPGDSSQQLVFIAQRHPFANSTGRTKQDNSPP
ncbi:unnamed protein product, partial [Ilex paraguariensis]